MQILNNVFEESHASRFERDSYLYLPSVKQAYSEVKSHPEFDNLLHNFAEFVLHEGLGDKFGLFLLHRHFLPAEGTQPIERIMKWGLAQETSLVTQMISDVDIDCAPSRWKYDVTLNRFVALEFSCDSKVKEAWSFLQSQSDLMHKIAKILLESGLYTHLGFTTADREILPKNSNKCLIESSDRESNASIVQVKEKPNFRSDTLIPTVWVPIKSCWCEEKYECHQWCWGYGSDTDCANVEHERFVEGHDRVPCM